jgi:hypothetical protein
MNLRLLASASVVTLLLSASVFAQNPLVGVWEHTTREGVLTIYTSEGVFATIGLPPGRPKVDKPLEELTDQELKARVAGIGPIEHGTYAVMGSRLTRQVVAALNPTFEGTRLAAEFRIEGETLILTRLSDKAELRFRRVRKAGAPDAK